MTRAFANVRFQRLVAVTVLGIAILYRAAQVFEDVSARPWAHDFWWYWSAALQLLHGQPIYSTAELSGPFAADGQNGFLYPPPFAAVALPFALLSPSDPLPAYVIWTVLNSSLALLVLWAVSRQLGLGNRFDVLSGPGWLLLAAAALVMPPVINELMIANVNLLLFSLFGIGWLGLRRADKSGDWIAGAAIGLAALIKLFPGLLLVWLVMSGRKRAAGAAVVAAAGAAAITLPITGLQPWIDFPRVLIDMGGPLNASFSLAPTTWLTTALGFDAARLIVTVAGLGFAAAVAPRLGLTAAYASTVVAALLITPILWEHYLAIAVLPLVLALGIGLPVWIVGAVYLLLSYGGAGTADPGVGVLRALPLIGLLILVIGITWWGRQEDSTPRALVPVRSDA